MIEVPFKELVVWQKSMELTLIIYHLIKHFPKEEMYALTSQICRAAVSIPSNIAEGQGRQSKAEFLMLDERTLFQNAEIIANFLYRLHNQKDIFSIKRKDLVLLHGDFSLNHILFNNENVVCGILDFADSRVGKFKSDFSYLLDDKDDEEFGANFGKTVLSIYESYKVF